MSWGQIIELNGRGIEFGSHGCSHMILSELSKADVLKDMIHSRAILNDKLGIDISGYSYPYTSVDQDARRMVEQAGYKFAVGGRGGKPPRREDPFYIPRIEISGSESMEDFIEKLPRPLPADEAARSKYLELRSRRDRATYMSR
jgi:peptidoglycan/xylan/chitin deacetylase (PgdA/CDA1 family)